MTNLNNRSENDTRLRIILLISYTVIISTLIVVTTGSDQLLFDQLILQLGSVLKDTSSPTR